MPDISMCDSETCPLKTKCYRNPASGTKPNEYLQAWFMGLTEWGEDCNYYWPRENRKMTKEKDGNDLAMIVVTDTVEHEDGSATYTFDIDDVSSKKITELGLEFILTCAAYGLDIHDALKHLVEYGKSIEGPYTAEEVGDLFDGS